MGSATQLQLASLQAFVQYKTAAANSITDWAFIKGQYRDVLPTSDIVRQYQQLFQQHSLSIMGHSVDISSAVAARMNRLLFSNAQYLVALCEVSALLHTQSFACCRFQRPASLPATVPAAQPQHCITQWTSALHWLLA